MPTILIILISLVIGYLIGYSVGAKHAADIEKNNIGNLKVVHTGEDGLYFFMEINGSPEQVARMDVVLLNVINQSMVTPK